MLGETYDLVARDERKRIPAAIVDDKTDVERVSIFGESIIVQPGHFEKITQDGPYKDIPETKTKLYNSQIQAWYEIL